MMMMMLVIFLQIMENFSVRAFSAFLYKYLSFYSAHNNKNREKLNYKVFSAV